MHKKIFIKTYGCQMNEYDSAKIVDLFVIDNFIPVSEPTEADLIILNTCSIRLKAEEKLFSDLGRYRKIKAKKPALIICVGGCVASQEKEKIIRRAPHVDIIFGPQTIHRLPQMYHELLKTEKRQIDTSFPQIEKFDYFPEPHTKNASAFVSIIEGCNRFCSYCIVPFTRGREVSRPSKDILKEILALAKQGVKEINLLGQNVNAYRGKSPSDKEVNLADLIREVAAIDEIKRIRFTTSHPADFTDDLVALYNSEPKLASHLHLPVQSGSDRILKLMRRGYTVEEFKTLITKVKAARPNICISSDFIIGFPGETAEDFADTMNLITDVYFDSSFSFIYSPRPNTTAAKLEDTISLEEKKQRLATMQNQLAKHTQQIGDLMIGTTQTVLVTDNAKKGDKYFSGRTENNRIVIFTTQKEVLGKMVDIKITEAMRNSLRGTIVD